MLIRFWNRVSPLGAKRGGRAAREVESEMLNVRSKGVSNMLKWDQLLCLSREISFVDYLQSTHPLVNTNIYGTLTTATFKDTETNNMEEPRGKGQTRQREKHTHRQESMTEHETVKELPCNYTMCSKLVTTSLGKLEQTRTPKLSSSISPFGSHVGSHGHLLWATSHPVSVYLTAQIPQHYDCWALFFY